MPGIRSRYVAIYKDSDHDTCLYIPEILSRCIYLSFCYFTCTLSSSTRDRRSRANHVSRVTYQNIQELCQLPTAKDHQVNFSLTYMLRDNIRMNTSTNHRHVLHRHDLPEGLPLDVEG